MKIAIQGELGSFSHQATLAMVKKAVVVPFAQSSEVFAALENKKVDAAIIPIENTLAGSVVVHYDLFLKYNFFIHQEFQLRIVHNLITTAGVQLSKIRRIFSHPIALEQCRKFLSKLPDAQAIPFYDTAGSVKHVVQEELRDAAAIASELAAAEYQGVILKKGIEDNKQNFTRFFLVSLKKKLNPKANKTTLAFSLKNEPGALCHALNVFASRNIDLSKIESRPVPGEPWQYVFFVDVLSGPDKVLDKALRELKKIAGFVKVLGSYIKAV